MNSIIHFSAICINNNKKMGSGSPYLAVKYLQLPALMIGQTETLILGRIETFSNLKICVTNRVNQLNCTFSCQFNFTMSCHYYQTKSTVQHSQNHPGDI